MVDAQENREKQLLLFLPGIDGTGRLLYRQTHLFTKYEVRCESYTEVQDETYALLAKNAAEIVRRLSPNRPATVLAESFGGAVAMRFAVECPELVERMILVNSFARFPSRFRLRMAIPLSRLFPWVTRYPVTRAIRSFFFLSRDVSKSERVDCWSRIEDVPMHKFRHRMQMILQLDLRDRLSEVQCPVLVISSSDDRVVPISAGREIARLIPNTEFVELQVGHGALIHPSMNIATLMDERGWGDSRPPRNFIPPTKTERRPVQQP